MKLRIALAVLLLTVGAGNVGVRAESLWKHREERAAYLYRDRAAQKRGDTLTVLIEEQTSFQEQGQRQLEKGSNSSAQASASAGGDQWFTPLNLSQDSSRQFEGSSSYARNRSFEDSITASVVDELPNGNLVIAGRVVRNIAGEKAVTILTGIVNPDDIERNNTVSSRRIGHMKLQYKTEGLSNHYLRMGFLNSILNYLWPF